MPGLDHEVHESVCIGGDEHRAGCWNKPRPNPNGGYFAPQRRFFSGGQFEVVSVWVPFRMSTECRYDQAISPIHCEGCEHLGSGKKYDEAIRRLGT